MPKEFEYDLLVSLAARKKKPDLGHSDKKILHLIRPSKIKPISMYHKSHKFGRDIDTHPSVNNSFLHIV